MVYVRRLFLLLYSRIAIVWFETSSSHLFCWFHSFYLEGSWLLNFIVWRSVGFTSHWRDANFEFRTLSMYSLTEATECDEERNKKNALMPTGSMARCHHRGGVSSRFELVAWDCYVCLHSTQMIHCSMTLVWQESMYFDLSQLREGSFRQRVG